MIIPVNPERRDRGLPAHLRPRRQPRQDHGLHAGPHRAEPLPRRVRAGDEGRRARHPDAEAADEARAEGHARTGQAHSAPGPRDRGLKEEISIGI